MTGVSPMDLVEVYLQGWAQSTLSAYGSAYQDIIRYCNVLGKHWCRWGSGEVSAFFINGFNHLPNSIKKFLQQFCCYFLVVVTKVVQLLGCWSPK